MSKVDRRQFGAGMLASSFGLGLPLSAARAEPVARAFPEGFRWGVATAAYQIEGSPKADGKGQSIWDAFAHTPGKIADGTTGDVATDSYRRYREDTQLIKNLGAGAYRFSVSWPRIFPNGRGKPNPKGVDHYKRVVDDLLENGIEPYVTLYHWDLPAALPGGWQNRDTAKAFADYAGYMAGQLSDRVKRFITVNELRSFIDSGYGSGKHAPGLKLPPGELNQVRHNALLAHGMGVQAIRARARSGAQVGLAENPITPVPVIETPEHIEAAKQAFRLRNAEYLTAILEGAYHPRWLEMQAANAPKVLSGEMATISSPLDFVAVNFYGPLYARAAPERPDGFALVPPPSSFPVMILPWLYVGPEGLYWIVRMTTELWKPKAIYISENGAAAADKLTSGRVDDSDRLMYLRNYIGHLQRATAEGFPVKGYFVWSLMDNFEWAEGYKARFGIHYVDFETQQRIPKLSAAWYKELIARNRMV